MQHVQHHEERLVEQAGPKQDLRHPCQNHTRPGTVRTSNIDDTGHTARNAWPRTCRRRAPRDGRPNTRPETSRITHVSVQCEHRISTTLATLQRVTQGMRKKGFLKRQAPYKTSSICNHLTIKSSSESLHRSYSTQPICTDHTTHSHDIY